MKRRTFLLTTSVIALHGSVAGATSNGIPGYSGEKGQACDTTGCHTGGAAPTLKLDGPAELEAGKEGEYTFEVTTALKNGSAGISATQGSKLAAGTNLKASGAELTHSAPVAAAGGKVTFSFKVTAPTSGTTMTIWAAGLGSDGVGTAGDGTAKTTKEIKITGGKPSTSSSSGGGGGDDDDQKSSGDDRFAEDPFSKHDAQATCAASPAGMADATTAAFFALAGVAFAVRGSRRRRD